MDPVEVRRRNLIPADEFPFTTADRRAPTTAATTTAALDEVLAARRLRRAAGRAGSAGASAGDAVQLGIGVSSYVEITAADARRRRVRPGRGAPRRHGHGLHRQLRRTARATHTAWAMLVAGGARHPDGQGHGRPRRHRPDPARHRHLRVAVAAARRHRRAQGRPRGQGRRRGSWPPTCSRPAEADVVLDIDRGLWHVARRPGAGADLGRAWPRPADRMAWSSPTSDFTARRGRRSRSAPTSRWSRSTPRPARSTLRAARRPCDDAGRVLNPVLVEGQRHGGIAQGAAQALLRGDASTTTTATRSPARSPTTPSSPRPSCPASSC